MKASNKNQLLRYICSYLITKQQTTVTKFVRSLFFFIHFIWHSISVFIRNIHLNHSKDHFLSVFKLNHCNSIPPYWILEYWLYSYFSIFDWNWFEKNETNDRIYWMNTFNRTHRANWLGLNIHMLYCMLMSFRRILFHLISITKWSIHSRMQKYLWVFAICMHS